MSAPAVEVRGLEKSYGEQVALRGIDFSAPAGSVLGVLGPNGAGKTTTIRILATLATPSAGEARICGHDVVAHPDEVRRLIGLTGQYASVDEELTGKENLRLLGELVGLRRGVARSRADEILVRVGLEADGGRRVRGYSGGMRRRLDLAASLVTQPSVIFLDEPSTGLDPVARGALWGAVASLRAAGTTVLLTSQYLEEIDALADAVLVIDRGVVVAHDTPLALKQRVGGLRLRLVLVDGAHAEDAATRLAASTGLECEVGDGSIVASVRAPSDAARILAAPCADELGITDARLSLPSLDEVFVALTGAGPVTR